MTKAQDLVKESLDTLYVEVPGQDRAISGESIYVVISNVLTFLTGLMGALALAVLVWAGFLYMSAAGNESQITKAKKIALWAIIGIVVAATAFIVLQFIQDVFSNPAASTTPSQ